MNRRIKRRAFKRHKELIQYAVRRSICLQREDKRTTKQKFIDWLKKNDWLEWAKRKLTRTR